MCVVACGVVCGKARQAEGPPRETPGEARVGHRFRYPYVVSTPVAGHSASVLACYTTLHSVRDRLTKGRLEMVPFGLVLRRSRGSTHETHARILEVADSSLKDTKMVSL